MNFIKIFYSTFIDFNTNIDVPFSVLVVFTSCAYV
jgi:hypothetical protein